MPSTRRPSGLLLLLALLLGLAGPAGCSVDTDEPRPPDAHPTMSTTGSTTAAADVVGAVTRALDARARAVRHADPEAFAAGLAGDRAFRDEQRTWFANVTQLPLHRFDYRLDPASVVRDGDAYWVVVDVLLQLDGYDDVPAAAPDRYRYVPPRRPSGSFRLTSVTDPDWEDEHPVPAQPWDDGPVEVREGLGVLGVFDAASVDEAPGLLASVESGIATVAATVPYDWSRSVVVYALSDPDFLESLDDVPGDDPGDLDAVAFPVPAGAGSDDVAATRFVLNPDVVTRPGLERDRLIRHELTHVAVGTRDDAAPVWLSEGLAEYVSVRPLAPADRKLPAEALAAAEAGVGDMPEDATFNNADSAAHYGLAWWAIEHLAGAYGEDAPWALLDALAEPGADPDAVLRERYATSTRELARQAGRLILVRYGSS